MPALLNTTATATVTAVTITSAQLTMVAGTRYRLASTTAAWVAFGSNPTAVAGAANNHLILAGGTLDIQCSAAALKLAIVRDTADGNATLSLVMDGAS
jgi:hypothetical protein